MLLVEELRNAPAAWRFVLCQGKRAYQRGWQDKRLTLEDVEKALSSGRSTCTNVGVLCGVPSGGLLFVDHDGESVDELLRTRYGIEGLPKTLVVTSGRPGRYQAIYRVPEADWDAMKTTKHRTNVKGPDGKYEGLELRWDGAQSIIAGPHPTSGENYHWLEGMGLDDDCPIAEAPRVLVEDMKGAYAPPSRAKNQKPAIKIDSLVEFMPPEKLLSRHHRQLVQEGKGEGERNDAGFTLACDLQGIDAWALQNGVRLADPVRPLFDSFASACNPPLTDRERDGIWASAAKQNPSPAIPHDKLEECVRAWQRRQGGNGSETREQVPPRERIATDDLPFTFLGFDRDVYYYLPRGTKQVVSINASNHVERRLLTLAPRGWWLAMFGKEQKNGDAAVDWAEAVSYLYEMQHIQGVYDARRVRGRGCWIDDQRTVIHLGDRMIVDRLQLSVGEIRSKFIYEQGASLAGPGTEALSLEECRRISDTAKLCRWEHPASAALLCGWVVLAPICGALRWRSHVWVVGGAGSGKSTLLSEFTRPLLGGMETSVLGASTEAGLRQHLGSDAIPVLMDEAEKGEHGRDEERIAALMELARASSSETGAKTLKGTASGVGQEYLIRSSFLLSSITSSLKQGSDKSRFALLQLSNPVNDTAEEARRHNEHWDKLRERLLNIDERTGRALIARTLQRLQMLRRECEVFADVASERFGNRRAGDQFGFLLAGAHSLTSDAEATRETAERFLNAYDWDEFLEPSRSAADHERCLSKILTHKVRVAGPENDVPLGELLEIVLGLSRNDDIEQGLAQKLLQRHGIKTETRQIIISSNHDAIGKILERTPWSSDWRTVLKQVPGATVTGSTYFRGGHQSRAVSLPVSSVVS